MSVPVFQGWFAFYGRRNRKSYFMFNLLYLPLLAACGFVEELIFDSLTFPHFVAPIDFHWLLFLNWFLLIPALVMTFCYGVVSAQRFRDFGWTGWAVLLCCIPIVGLIASFALLVIPGTRGANQYGADSLAL